MKTREAIRLLVLFAKVIPLVIVLIAFTLFVMFAPFYYYDIPHSEAADEFDKLKPDSEEYEAKKELLARDKIVSVTNQEVAASVVIVQVRFLADTPTPIRWEHRWGGAPPHGHHPLHHGRTNYFWEGEDKPRIGDIACVYAYKVFSDQGTWRTWDEWVHFHAAPCQE